MVCLLYCLICTKMHDSPSFFVIVSVTIKFQILGLLWKKCINKHKFQVTSITYMRTDKITIVSFTMIFLLRYGLAEGSMCRSLRFVVVMFV